MSRAFAVFVFICDLPIFEARSQKVVVHDSASAENAQDQSFYLGKPVIHPEALSGIWESPDGHGGVIGLHLMLDAAAPNDATTLPGIRQSWLDLQASIYQRAGGKFRPGEQNGFSDSPRGGGLRYENGRLTLHYPGFDLDLLHIAGDRWSGRVHRKEFDSQVTLTRPGFETATKKEWFVGSWLSTNGPFHSCLHIAQQAPGEFLAWSDSLPTLGSVRIASGVARPPYSWEHYGELANARSAENGNAEIELYAYTGMCCSHRFFAAPAENGTVMKADWPPGANQAPHKTEWEKMPGDTCIASVSP